MVTEFTNNRLLPKKSAVNGGSLAVPALVRLVSILADQAARELVSSEFATSYGTRSENPGNHPRPARLSSEP